MTKTLFSLSILCFSYLFRCKITLSLSTSSIYPINFFFIFLGSKTPQSQVLVSFLVLEAMILLQKWYFLFFFLNQKW
uniref:Uncharacterized protein n=1 Tax=Rhizophora mucronata TaxID=61149 RepID=A0A2P2PMN6_RHIMU